MCAITAVCIETKNRVENGNTKNISLGRWREDWKVIKRGWENFKEQNVRLTEANIGSVNTLDNNHRSWSARLHQWFPTWDHQTFRVKIKICKLFLIFQNAVKNGTLPKRGLTSSHLTRIILAHCGNTIILHLSEVLTTSDLTDKRQYE